MKVAIVVGTHRSGTSMMAGIITYLGFWPGYRNMVLPADHLNEAGYFENKLLRSYHKMILGPWQLAEDDWRLSSKWNQWRSVYIGIISALLFEADRIGAEGLLIKDPRLCYLLPFLIDALRICDVEMDDIYVIRTIRCAIASSRSILAAGEARDDKQAMSLVRKYEKQLYDVLERMPWQWCIHNVHGYAYEMILKHPESYVSKIARALGVEPTERAIEFVMPWLRHF